ncbi:MAG: hypothetical protein K2X46_06915 [Roseomonas sp.]|nr:hypothetical protein [Roseomonas sp.]
MNAAHADPLDLLRDAIEAERARSGSIKAAIGHVSVAFGLKPRRVEGVWWNEPIRLDWQEADRIRAVSVQRIARERAEWAARDAKLTATLEALGKAVHR